jgi:hypothetical protein
MTTRAYLLPEDYFDHIKSLKFDVNSPKDGAIFYSDDFQGNKSMNRLRAENYSDGGKTKTTLEQTKGGRWLDDEKLFEHGSPIDDPDAKFLWGKASRQYAQQASGDTRCFVTGSSPRSIFRTVELPALLQNPNVTSLNGIPRQMLADIFNKDPETAFNSVAAADTALRPAEVAGPAPPRPPSVSPAGVAAPEAPPPPSMGGGGGPLLVIDNLNMIICTGCPKPQPLKVTMNQTEYASKQLSATIADCVPALNIKPFGPCLFTPAPPSTSGGPCIPKPLGMWQPGSSMTKIQKIPALRQTDTLKCASGGTISVMMPGQTHTLVQ